MSLTTEPQTSIKPATVQSLTFGKPNNH